MKRPPKNPNRNVESARTARLMVATSVYHLTRAMRELVSNAAGRRVQVGAAKSIDYGMILGRASSAFEALGELAELMKKEGLR